MESRIIVPAAVTAALFASGLTGHAFAGEGDSCALLGLSSVEYGLCNAYCEIMDCDSDDPLATDGACQRLEGKFYARTVSMPPCALEAVGAVIEEVETEPGYTGALVNWPDGTFQGFLEGHNQSGEFGARSACEAKLHVCFLHLASSGDFRLIFDEALPSITLVACKAICLGVLSPDPHNGFCSIAGCQRCCDGLYGETRTYQ